MINFIKKTIFYNKTKTTIAANIFLVLCFYTVFTTIYGYFIVDDDKKIAELLVRLALGLFIISSYVFCERSRISINTAAFIVPSCIISAIFAGAVYSGDVLVFIYIVGAAMLSLTYLKKRSLLLYLLYSVLVSLIIMLVFDVNMMGEEYKFIHNIIFLIVAIALGVIIYFFCGAYANTIDSLVEAENKATEALKAKSNFLARMSHEIRTPLNAIIGLTDIQLRKDLPFEENEVFTNIGQSGKLLLGIINDILDLSKIESGKFDLIPEEYSIADLLYDIIQLNIVRIGVKPIDFTVNADPSLPDMLIGDALRIKQLLNNLLSNAFKYTNKGNVVLDLKWSQENGLCKLIFKITDTGMGIKPDDLKQLFSEYSQVNKQANKQIEGTGLGLSICKWLAELMGGTVYAESVYEQGSTFTAEIIQEISNEEPVGEEKASALLNFTYTPMHKKESIKIDPIPNGKVLLVDDVEINLMVAEALLEPYEMKVDCTSSGAEAIRIIANKETEYDIIFMDHMMPGMDGVETASAIRELKTEYAKTVPIIALTANAIAGSRKMFIENGFQDFLAKPIEISQLDTILRKWIRSNFVI